MKKIHIFLIFLAQSIPPFLSNAQAQSSLQLSCPQPSSFSYTPGPAANQVYARPTSQASDGTSIPWNFIVIPSAQQKNLGSASAMSLSYSHGQFGCIYTIGGQNYTVTTPLNMRYGNYSFTIAGGNGSNPVSCSSSGPVLCQTTGTLNSTITVSCPEASSFSYMPEDPMPPEVYATPTSQRSDGYPIYWSSIPSIPPDQVKNLTASAMGLTSSNGELSCVYSLNGSNYTIRTSLGLSYGNYSFTAPKGYSTTPVACGSSTSTPCTITGTILNTSN